MLDYKKTGVKLLALAGVVVAVFAAIYLGIYFWPFAIGIALAFILEKPVNAVVTKLKISRKIVGTIAVVITFLLIAGIIALAITSLVNEAISLSAKIPNIYENLKLEYKTIYTSITEMLDRTPSGVSESLYNIGLNILSKLATLTTKLANTVINFIIFIPNILIYIIITFLATLFLVIDRKFMTDILPNSWVKKITDVIAKCFISLTKYLKALLILITVTFVELLIAFVILKVDYPLTIAIIGALIDALPILGISALLLPWAIYSAVTGELGFGISLVILYFIMTIVRQLIEPKVVSNNLGTHPFITLLCMYLGFKILGLAGLIIGPVLMIIFKNVFSTMFKSGYFKNIFVLKKEKKVTKE